MILSLLRFGLTIKYKRFKYKRFKYKRKLDLNREELRLKIEIGLDTVYDIMWYISLMIFIFGHY